MDPTFSPDPTFSDPYAQALQNSSTQGFGPPGPFINPFVYTDTPTGYATPEQIAQLRSLSQYNMTGMPEAKSWAGVIAHVLGGFSGNRQMQQANQFQVQNAYETAAKMVPQGGGGGGLLGSAPPAGAASGGNPNAAVSYYTSQGLPQAAAAGLGGAFQAESGMNPNVSKIGDGRDGSPSYGLGQWNGQRARNLQAYAAAHGKSPSDPQVQLDFPLVEMGLKGQPGDPGYKSELKSGQALLNARTPQDATAAALMYERPAGYTPNNPMGALSAQKRLAYTSALMGGQGGGGQPIQVAQNGSGPLGGYSPRSYTSDQTGAFAHCSALSSYGSGLLLMVLVNSSFRWSLRLARPGAQMTPGISVPVELTFDGRSQYHIVGNVLTNELAEISMPEGSALVQTFRHSSQMSVSANGFAAVFNLTQTDALFPALTACVRKNLGLPDVAMPRAAPRQPSVKKPVTPAVMPSAPVATTEPEKPNSPATKAEKELSGTGFFVSSQGHVLTNAHVVKDCSIIEVPGPNGLTAVQVVARDETNDLALLKTNLTPSRIAQLRAGIRLGEPVAAFGYPLLGFLSSTGNFTLGNVTSLTGLRDDTRYLQISTPVQPGNSGGPLLDASGNFVGVVSAKLNALLVMVATDGDIPQNVNFAIKSSVAATFLESNSVGFTTGTIGVALAPTDLADQAKAVSLPVLCK